jgi:hypothetical protein
MRLHVQGAARFFRLAVVAVSIALGGCGSGTEGSSEHGGTVTLTRPGAVGSDTGSIGFQLSLPSGQEIPVLSWAVSGPNGLSTVVQNGTLTAQSAGVTFLIGNLPVASGYEIALSGTASDGSVICSGSASFAIASRTTTPVVVELACSTATQGSHVTLVSGSSFNCAASNNVSASPTETTVGGQIMLTATATGPVPADLTYGWSAPSGTFGTSPAANTTFTCTSVGAVNVTLVVGDGPVPAGSSCDQALDTRTIVIQCDAATQPDAGGGQPDAGGGQDGGGGGGGPPAAPALPPWGTSALAGALLGLGALASRRRYRAER